MLTISDGQNEWVGSVLGTFWLYYHVLLLNEVQHIIALLFLSPQQSSSPLPSKSHWFTIPKWAFPQNGSVKFSVLPSHHNVKGSAPALLATEQLNFEKNRIDLLINLYRYNISPFDWNSIKIDFKNCELNCHNQCCVHQCLCSHMWFLLQ